MASLSEIVSDHILNSVGKELYLVYDEKYHIKYDKIELTYGPKNIYKQTYECTHIGLYTSIEAAYDSIISYIYDNVLDRYLPYYYELQYSLNPLSYTCIPRYCPNSESKKIKISDIKKDNIENIFYEITQKLHSAKDADFYFIRGLVSSFGKPILLDLDDIKNITNPIQIFKTAYVLNATYHTYSRNAVVEFLNLQTTIKIQRF